MPRIKKFDFQVQVEEPEGSGNFKLLTLSGTPVVIQGYEKFNFVFHKFPGLKYNCITELKTGARICYWCKTKADAIKQAKWILDQEVGGNHEKFQRRMQYVRTHKIKVKGWEGKWLNESRGGLL